MEWLEANPLPVECGECQEDECYNCDIVGKRWHLSEEDELLIQRRLREKASERLQKKM